jgi:hypothetical protein
MQGAHHRAPRRTTRRSGKEVCDHADVDNKIDTIVAPIAAERIDTLAISS